MTRRHDPRSAKPHRNYTAADLAELFSVGITTIRAWTKAGLSPIDERRPFLFAGGQVQSFLEKYNKPRQPLQPGELYCVACKQPVTPAGNLVELVRLTATTGDFIGACPHCPAKPHRRVRLAEVAEKAGPLCVHYEDGTAPFVATGEPPRIQPSKEVVA